MAGVSTYTDEVGEMICLRLSDGESLRQICSDPDMPNISTVIKWRSDVPAFSAQYAHAREAQGHEYAHKVSSTADRVLTGELDPAAARVAIDGFKWTAARMARKDYGDRLQLDADVSLTSLTDEQLDAQITARLAEAGIASVAAGEESAEGTESAD